MSNVFLVQTLNRFAFEKVTDIVKKLKNELKSKYKNIKRNNTETEDERTLLNNSMKWECK